MSKASALDPGTGYFNAGLIVDPSAVGGRVQGAYRWDSHWYGFVEGAGGYHYEHGPFGQISLGIGGTW